MLAGHLFDLGRDVALAWHYVISHWPERRTSPELQIIDGKTKVFVRPGPGVAPVVDALLGKAVTVGGDMAQSAAALRKSLENRDFWQKTTPPAPIHTNAV